MKRSELKNLIKQVIEESKTSRLDRQDAIAYVNQEISILTEQLDKIKEINSLLKESNDDYLEISKLYAIECKQALEENKSLKYAFTVKMGKASDESYWEAKGKDMPDYEEFFKDIDDKLDTITSKLENIGINYVLYGSNIRSDKYSDSYAEGDTSYIFIGF